MPSFAETMQTKFETLLAANVGVSSVTVDGTAVSYADLEKKWQFWRNQVLRESGNRPRFKTLDLSGPADAEET